LPSPSTCTSAAQPSLSHQIRQLEQELQAELFKRANRRIRLTEAGRVLLEEARDILAHAERAAVLSRQAGGGATRLRVGYAGWMDVSKILSLMDEVRRRRPEVGVELTEMSGAEEMAALRADEIDAAFLRPPVADTSLAIEFISGDRFLVALPQNHRLASKQSLRLSVLADEFFIVFGHKKHPWIYDLTLKLCREAGFIPRARHVVEDPRVALGLVAAGTGIAFAPASICSLAQGVSLVRPRPLPPMTLTALAWRRADLSPVVGELVAVVRDASRQERGPRAAKVPQDSLRRS
jgi:DNA-binding transcriptional LysR family regulator